MPYKDPAKRAAAKAKYKQTEKGKASEARYLASSKGREAKARAAAQPHRLASRAEYTQTDSYKEARKRAREKYEAKPEVRLTKLMRHRLRMAIKNNWNRASAIQDLGCSLEEFKAYIEARWEPGMTWENHGKTWHIDHVRPLGLFDLTIQEQLLQAVHFTNLQPLSTEAHKIKSAQDRRDILAYKASL